MAKELTLFEKIRKISFQYCIEYDYTRVEAEDHDERCKDDYCRCTTMENFVVEKVEPKRVAEQIIKTLEIADDARLISQLEKVANKFSIDTLDFNTCGGYYGDELESVTISDWSLISEIENIIDIKLSRRKKLEQIKNAKT